MIILLTVASTSPTVAATARDQVMLISTASTIQAKKTGCSKVEVTYKISPNYRDLPALIVFAFDNSNDPESGDRFGSLVFKYNWYNGTWKSNNADFSDIVSFSVCDLKKSGTYFVTAKAQFETDGDLGTAPITNWLAVKVKAKVR